MDYLFTLELPSWLDWDKWYVKAGLVVAATSTLTAVGYIADTYFPQEEKPAGGAGGMPAGFQEALAQMVAAQGGGGGAGGGGGPPAGGIEQMMAASAGKSTGAASSSNSLSKGRARATASSSASKKSSIDARTRHSTESQREAKIRQLYSLARQHVATGQYKLAEREFLQLIDLFTLVVRDQGGENPSIICMPMRELGGLYKAMSRYSDAENMLRSALQIQNAEFLANSSNPTAFRNKMTIQNELANMMQLQCKWEPAYKLLDEIYFSIRQRLPRDSSGDIIDGTQLQPILRSLITNAIHLSKYDRALSYADDLEKLRLSPQSQRSKEQWFGLNHIQRARIYLAQQRDAMERCQRLSVSPDAESAMETALEEAHAITQKVQHHKAKIMSFTKPGNLSRSVKLTNVLIRRGYATVLVEFDFDTEAAEEFLEIYKQYGDIIDKKPLVKEESSIRAYVFEAVNDAISSLHNAGLDKRAVQYYDVFKQRHCAVLSQSRFFNTRQAKVFYDVARRETGQPWALLVVDLSLTKDSFDGNVPKIPEGALVEVKHEKLLHSYYSSKNSSGTDVASDSGVASDSADVVDTTDATDTTDSTDVADTTDATDTTDTTDAADSTDTTDGTTDATDTTDDTTESPTESSTSNTTASSSSNTSNDTSSSTNSPFLSEESFHTTELTISKEDLKRGTLKIVCDPEEGSVNKLYEVGITIYSDKSKSERIGYHHQLVNCAIDTMNKPVAEILGQIRVKKLFYQK